MEPIKKFLKRKDIELSLRRYSIDALGAMAQGLFCSLLIGTIIKTVGQQLSLSFLVDGHAILIVAAGDAKVDNPKYKAQFGTKAKMLTPQEAEELVGHAVGGVCPFAVNQGVTVYLDQSLKRFETVFPACGSGNSAIELSIPELEQYSGYTAWVDVCKGWQ